MISSGDSIAASRFDWMASTSPRVISVWLAGSTCRKSGLVNIIVDMPAVHSMTWGRMYRRNAADDHLPRIMIFKTEARARNRAIAAPERRECVPISLGRYPNMDCPPPLVHDDRRSRIVSSALMNRGLGVVVLESWCGSNQQFTGVVGGASGL